MAKTLPLEAQERQDSDEFETALGAALKFVANESFVLAQLERHFSPRPAQLITDSDDEKKLSCLTDKVMRLYGGVPRLIIQFNNDPPPTFDTYLSAALDEALGAFKRARRSLCRAQVFLIGNHLLKKSPDLLGLQSDRILEEVLQTSTTEIFWEHTETTFIRLAGFWDRLGQILDFAFFNIRKYERDGFSAVVDRIRGNTLLMRPDIQQSDAWKAIWAYKKSERADGLQWLLSRRNMLVHSLHLRPLPEQGEEELFRSMFNHLDARLRDDLKPAAPEEEIQRLIIHLGIAASLLRKVLELCEKNAKSPE